MNDKKCGLVFSGGGGRGAYQIGVWKALDKLGIASNITAVSGTSVGALNAALFSSVSVNKAESIWRSISPKDILDDRNVNDINPLIGSLSPSHVSAINACLRRTKDFTSVSDLTDYIGEKMRFGVFSRNGLKKKITKNNIHTMSTSSSMPCYVCCFDIADRKPCYYDLCNFTSDEALTLLLASSAIPVIFPAEIFEQKNKPALALACIGAPFFKNGIPNVMQILYDGGIVDNTPVKPLYDLGYRRIIISYLNSEKVIKPINKSLFPNAEIIEIIPSESIDDGKKLKGLLEFDSESVDRRINLGESDCLNLLSKNLVINKWL